MLLPYIPVRLKGDITTVKEATAFSSKLDCLHYPPIVGPVVLRCAVRKPSSKWLYGFTEGLSEFVDKKTK